MAVLVYSIPEIDNGLVILLIKIGSGVIIFGTIVTVRYKSLMIQLLHSPVCYNS